MNILKEVLQHEVFPAFGCTEPIAVAHAAAVAARELGHAPETIRIIVDPGVFKNGQSVNVPNTGGERGNLIAGVVGALLARPDLKMEILKIATPETIREARQIIADGRAVIDFDPAWNDLTIDVMVQYGMDRVRVVIAGSHTNLVRLEKNGVVQVDTLPGTAAGEPAYRSVLRRMKIEDLVRLADAADSEDVNYIRQGVDMNLAMAAEGFKLKKVGFHLAQLMPDAEERNDILGSSKILTASASDGRMAGLPYPVMSSGGAGNQGVVAILVAHRVGGMWHIEPERILRSIALSHLVNAYVKCHTGDLSVICGCAIAAGMGAAVALVYQVCGGDMHRIDLAVNTVVSDLGGIFCDGAKEGCALKVVSSTDAAIRAAYLAIHGQGVTSIEGIAGAMPGETIRNLCRISEEGMRNVNRVILDIMRDKPATPQPVMPPDEKSS
ncbi:serine dehydratase subunit alpha family protein [bacterium]|nr:serine dehydratase subunit alpha family protein [candidate division CSSED10-310 bacterium]